MLTPIIIVVLVGLVCAIILTIASKVFYVPVDETFAELREALPGANCGGCGYAGCDDYAVAMAEDRSVSCTKCPVGGAECAAKLAEILGVAAGATDKEVAVVMCNGNNQSAKKLLEYQGLRTCAAAKQFFGGVNECAYGCIGFGDCDAACEFEAIKVVNGVAKVDRNNCVACGACVKACPNNIIRISTAKNNVIVKCSSTAKGGEVRKACTVGCIGCKKCEKVCKFDSVHVENNLSYIDPVKCKNCGACEKVCPTGTIINLRLIAKQMKDIKKESEAPKVAEPVKKDAKAEEKVEVKKDVKKVESQKEEKTLDKVVETKKVEETSKTEEAKDVVEAKKTEEVASEIKEDVKADKVEEVKDAVKSETVKEVEEK